MSKKQFSCFAIAIFLWLFASDTVGPSAPRPCARWRAAGAGCRARCGCAGTAGLPGGTPGGSSWTRTCATPPPDPGAGPPCRVGTTTVTSRHTLCRGELRGQNNGAWKQWLDCLFETLQRLLSNELTTQWSSDQSVRPSHQPPTTRAWKEGYPKVRDDFELVSIVSYSRPSLTIIASASQFHVYLPWGQCLWCLA